MFERHNRLGRTCDLERFQHTLKAGELKPSGRRMGAFNCKQQVISSLLHHKWRAHSVRNKDNERRHGRGSSRSAQLFCSSVGCYRVSPSYVHPWGMIHERRHALDIVTRQSQSGIMGRAGSARWGEGDHRSPRNRQAAMGSLWASGRCSSNMP